MSYAECAPVSILELRDEPVFPDLFSILSKEIESKFDYDDWYRGEQYILKPALEKLGYTHISFYNLEVDCSGPLIRGVRAKKNGNAVRFMYG